MTSPTDAVQPAPMDNFAALAFYNTPNPSFVLCDNLRIHAVNAAAKRFFGKGQRWETEANPCSHFDNEIPAHMSIGIPLDELNIGLESDGHDWQGILSRARLHKASQENVEHGGLADLPPSEEFAFRYRQPDGDIIANLSISSWSHHGHNFYLMIFYRRRRHQNPPADFISPVRTPSPDGSDGVVSPDLMLDYLRARELVHLKSAFFESCSEINSLLSIDGKTCYLNRTGSAIVGGIRVCDYDWLQRQFDMWDENFEKVIEKREWPELAAHHERRDIPARHYGFITDEGERIMLTLEGRCLLDPFTGAYIGSACFGRKLGQFEAVRAKLQDDMLKSCETITESVPHFIWTAYRDGSRDWFSKQWCDYTGLSLDECLGWGWVSAIHPDDLDQLHMRRACALENETGYSVELRCRRWDGEYQWMLMRGLEITSDHQAVANKDRTDGFGLGHR